MSSLVLLKKTTVENCAKIQVVNIFNSDYDVYKLVFTNATGTQSSGINIRYITDDGNVDSSSNYDQALQDLRGNVDPAEYSEENETDFEGWATTTYSNANTNNAGTTYVFSPYNSSSYTFHSAHNIRADGSSMGSENSIGVYTQANIVTGFEARGGNASLIISSLTIKVYGVRSS
tara:strand:- start:201 stop:725 length:525 start_codon:yes stop_codon:yes gene_type:complete